MIQKISAFKRNNITKQFKQHIKHVAGFYDWSYVEDSGYIMIMKLPMMLEMWLLDDLSVNVKANNGVSMFTSHYETVFLFLEDIEDIIDNYYKHLQIYLAQNIRDVG